MPLRFREWQIAMVYSLCLDQSHEERIRLQVERLSCTLVTIAGRFFHDI